MMKASEGTKFALTDEAIDRQWVKDLRRLLQSLDDELTWAEKLPEVSGVSVNTCTDRMNRFCQNYFKYREEEKQRLTAKAKTARKRLSA